MNRRDFLRGAAAVGGAAVMGKSVSAWAGGRSAATDVVAQLAGSVLNNPATACPIDTIVVLMMENRSFDHYFGWLAADESYLEAGRSRYGSDFAVDGTLDLTYLRTDGSEAPTHHLPGWAESLNPYRGCGGHPDPGHGWDSGRAQRDHGFVAEGTENDDFAIGYFLEDDLPCYRQLARNGTVFDRYFASLMASTYPNREYMHSAQSGGLRDNYLPLAELGFQWPNIWDRLMAAGVPSGMYAVDLPTTILWGARMLPITHPVAQLFADAALGTLPHVTFIDPGFLTGLRTDDHPHGDMRMGQRFVAQMLQTLQASPQWERMAVFITYDEWGGFFDHVTPPVFVDDLGSADDANNYGQAGFRLPVSLVSPFARPGYVDHRVYDHTSILRLIEWRFLGAPAMGPGGDSGWWLTSRDRNANNIGAALAAERVNDFVLDANAVPIVVSTPCAGQFFQDVPGVDTVEDEVLTPVLGAIGIDLDDLPIEITIEPSAFELANDSGFFDAVGFRVDPSLTLQELLGA